jgi:hypothetical protein
MTIVADPVAIKQVAVARPSVLSFNNAVADFGFLELLGTVLSLYLSVVTSSVLWQSLWLATSRHDRYGAILM